MVRLIWSRWEFQPLYEVYHLIAKYGITFVLVPDK